MGKRMFLWDMNYINDVDKTYNYDGLADANYGGNGDCGNCGDRMGRSDRHWCMLCVAHLD